MEAMSTRIGPPGCAGLGYLAHQAFVWVDPGTPRRSPTAAATPKDPPGEFAQGEGDLSRRSQKPRERAGNGHLESVREKGRGRGCRAAGGTRRWGSPESASPEGARATMGTPGQPTQLPDDPTKIWPREARRIGNWHVARDRIAGSFLSRVGSRRPARGLVRR